VYENSRRTWKVNPGKTHEDDRNVIRTAYLEELAELTTKISLTISSLTSIAETGISSEPITDENKILIQMKSIIVRRRKREQFLPADIFADPAWDMLLDLSVAKLEVRKTSVSSLCIGAAVPTTTALRWIRQLEQLQMIKLTPDPVDRRRQHVDIADKAFTNMLRLFGAPV